MWTATVSMQLPKRIRQTKQKTKFGFTSLLQERGRDMLGFAFFFAVSAGFWLLQKLDDTIETDIRVPLELTGVPKGAIITSPLPKVVTITVKDRGTNLFNYMRRSNEAKPIRLDFAAYDNGSVASKVSIPPADLQRAFQQQMSSSASIVRLQPTKFEFHYNRGMSRRIPVKFRGHVSTRQQNYLQDISFSQDSVLVYAPSQILDTLKYAYTEQHDIVDLDKTTTVNLSFPKISGVKVVPETIQMTAYVDYYTEQTVQVPIIGVNFPAGISLKTFPAVVSVKYRVGAANARHIHAENFVLVAAYEELKDNRNQKHRLRLKTIPLGVSHVRIFPQEVDFLLEHTSANIAADSLMKDKEVR